MKVEKSYVAPKWLKIKEIYENGTNGSDKYGTNFPIGGDLDLLTSEFIYELGEMTQRNGYNYIVDDVKLDLWKDRIWCLVENAGLLREVAWKEEKMDRKGETYHDLYLEQQNRDEFDIPENEPSNEDLESINLEKLMRND
tara:strand:+ start:10376 stop:10795 length:420 start_codon:yes stop_codon:yes gene_type:complete